MEINNNTTEVNNTSDVKLSYYQRNRERLLERQKIYNKEHQKEHIERNKKYYNKEYFRLYYHSKLSPKKNDQSSSE